MGPFPVRLYEYLVPRYETTGGYLTTVEKAAIVREGIGSEPISSTQVLVRSSILGQSSSDEMACLGMERQ